MSQETPSYEHPGIERRLLKTRAIVAASAPSILCVVSNEVFRRSSNIMKEEEQ